MTRFLVDDSGVADAQSVFHALATALTAADFARTDRLPLPGSPLDALLDPLSAVRGLRGRSNLLEPSGLPRLHRALLRGHPAAVMLHRLFTAGETLPGADVAPLLGDLLPELVRVGAIGEGPTGVRSEIMIVPYRGRFYVSDALRHRERDDYCYLGRASFVATDLALAELTPDPVPPHPRRLLDLGCGPAVGALAPSDLATEVVGSDLVPRALRFGRLNAALNGIDHATFVLSDLTADVDGTFDVVLTHPPGVWSDDLPDGPSGSVVARQGGSDFGLELPQAMITAGLARVRPGGVLYAVVFAPVLTTGEYVHEVIRRICAEHPADVVVRPLLAYVEYADVERYRRHGVREMRRYLLTFRPRHGRAAADPPPTTVSTRRYDRGRLLSSQLRTVPARLASRFSRRTRPG